MDEAIRKRIGIPALKERIMHPAKHMTPREGIDPETMAAAKKVMEVHRDVLRALPAMTSCSASKKVATPHESILLNEGGLPEPRCRFSGRCLARVSHRLQYRRDRRCL